MRRGRLRRRLRGSVGTAPALPIARLFRCNHELAMARAIASARPLERSVIEPWKSSGELTECAPESAGAHRRALQGTG
eukprot:5021946-Alexandrium_andersonii.AAC.1